MQQEQTMDDDISISVNGQWVTINGAQGLTLEVVSLTGQNGEDRESRSTHRT